VTCFVVDLSHYDGAVTEAEMRTWITLGVVGVTHKIGEGLANDDPLDGTVLARARAAGMPVLGGYFIPHQGVDPVAEAKRCIQLADRDEPWWREFPYWFWQIDAERWSPTDRPTPAEIKAFSDALVRESGLARMRVCYASAGQYADDLAGLGLPLWNARYGANPAQPFRAAYTTAGGDAGTGWHTYSGRTPVLWQFGSRTTVGTTTTTDCSAFRGTPAQLMKLIRPDLVVGGQVIGGTGVSLTSADQAAVWHNIIDLKPDGSGQPLPKEQGGKSAAGYLAALLANDGDMAKMITTLADMVKTIATLSTSLSARLDRIESALGALGGLAGGEGLTGAQLAAMFRRAADSLDPPAAAGA